jgi:hypothetical protein
MRKEKRTRLEAKGVEVRHCEGLFRLIRRGVGVYRTKNSACRSFASTPARQRLVASGSRRETSVESIARRQDGSRRLLGFPGPPHPLPHHARSLRPRTLQDHGDTARCVVVFPRQGLGGSERFASPAPLGHDHIPVHTTRTASRSTA